MARVTQIDPAALFDGIADKLALPKPSRVLNEVAPKTVARRLGVPTPDRVVDEAMLDARRRLPAPRLPRIRGGRL